MKLYPKRKFVGKPPTYLYPLDGEQIQPASIIARSIKNLTLTNAKIATLDASKITTGYLSADRIEAGSIDAKIANIAYAKITDVAIVNADVVNLDAGKITTGTLVVARTEAKCTDATADKTSTHTCNSPDDASASSRANAGLDSSGFVQKVVQGTKITGTPATGLNLTPTYMGYYDGSAWKSFIKS
ncbi:unnamed protein product, partial [marine sediment metagenome]